MRRKGFNFVGALIWSVFVLLGAFVFNSIISDMKSDREQYQLLLLATVVVLFVAIIVYHVMEMKRANLIYAKFEELFPEGISIVEKQASQFSETGQVAVFQHYFVSNWEFDFVDLNQVKNIYYERTMAIRRPTGAVVGDNPRLVFVMQNHDKKAIKITPFGMQEYLPKIFEAMHTVNSELTFGENNDNLVDYLPIFAQMR